MPSQLRSIIIFDGSNFYHKLKELGMSGTINFDYAGFSKYLAKDTKVVSKYFCIGKVQAKQNDAKARLMMANQQSLVTRLQKQNFKIQFGFLLKSGNVFHEKGTDIQIAVDILVNAYKDKFDQAYLVSSDSDLIPAIKAAQSLRKKVIYVGFRHKISYALLRACKRSILLTADDLAPFAKE